MREKRGLYDPSFEHDACGVGFVANVNGERTHEIIQEGVTILLNLEHRGAIGGDQMTGDGAGMMVQLPHDFFVKVLDYQLPARGSYGVGFLFLPRHPEDQREALDLVEKAVARRKGRFIGTRRVPV